MNAKNLIIVGAAAMVLLGAALLLDRGAEAPSTLASNGSPAEAPRLFPGLEDRMNDVARVELADKNTTGGLNLVRYEGHWGLEEKDGYPVQMNQVRQVIRSLAEMEKRERKTSNPELFGRVDVGEVGPESEARLVRLYDEGGELVAAALLGRADFQAYTEPHQYVRIEGEDQVWLAKGRLSPPVAERSLLESNVLDIGADRPIRMEVEHADGEILEATREATEQTEFDFAGVPESRSLTAGWRRGEPGRLLQRVTLDDVKPLAEADLDGRDTSTVTVDTVDGLRIMATAYLAPEEEPDARPLFAFEAEVNREQIEAENGRRTAEAEAQREAAEAAAEESGQNTSTAVPEPELIDVDAMEEEAAEINRRVQGWVYTLPGHIESRMLRRLEYFLEPEEEEEDGDDGDAAEETAGEVSAATLPITIEGATTETP